ncbi:MAG: hypothetical protein V5A25_13395, partial [Halovenus sp.]
MSRVLAHFAVGAIITAGLVHLLLRDSQYGLSVITLGGLWGVIPDAHGFLPVYADAVRQVEESAWADIFWFHRTMDQLEKGAGSPQVTLALVVVLVVVVAVLEWRDTS